MSKYYGVSLEDHYKAEFCVNCLYADGCNSVLYPEHNEDTKITTLKCKNYERRPSDENQNQ